jgi:cation-transporting ATPase 13A3/4/5
MGSVIIFSVAIEVYTVLVSERKVKHMAEHLDECFVFRDGEWHLVSTTDLVPGDLVGVQAGKPYHVIPLY